MKIKNILMLSALSLTLNLNIAVATTETLTTNTCLHKDPANSQVILIVPSNTALEIIEEKNDWKKVKYNEQEGWYSLKTKEPEVESSSTSSSSSSSTTTTTSSSGITQKTSTVTRKWSVGGKTFTSTGKQSNYPSASRSNLKFPDSTHSKIHPVFADRLNDMAKDLGGTLVITSGFRSIDRQISLIQSYYKTGKYTIGDGGKLIKNGKTMVAKPGYSKHQTGIAVDVSSSGIGAKVRKMSNSQLKKYGVYKPMSYEDWHLQPIL